MEIRRRILPPGWYPESAQDCRRDISDFDNYIKQFSHQKPEVHGGVIPHAGWYFSGRLAALVLSTCAAQFIPDVVALFGGHLGAGPGIIYADSAWETPLGALEMDRELSGALLEQAPVRREGPATNDNTVEIQLPLIKHFFPTSRLLALRAPHSNQAIDIGRLTAELARSQGKTLLAFASTDLTHYGPNYGFSPKGRGRDALDWVREENDQGFIDLALAMDEPGLLDHAAAHHSACSAGGVAAASAACKSLGAAQGELLDYYTSADIMPGDSFVGYAGILY